MTRRVKTPAPEADIRFGLESQGHIPTIEKMLAEGASWETIGEAIGWEPGAARTHYGWHLTQPKPFDLTQPAELARLLSELEGYMRISVKHGTDTEGRQLAYEALRDARAAGYRLMK